MTRVPQTTRQILNTINQLQVLKMTLRQRLRSDSAGESLKIRKVSIDVQNLIDQLDLIAGKMTVKTGSSIPEVKAKLQQESSKRRSGQLGSKDTCEEPVAKSSGADLGGVMIALYPSPAVASSIAVPGGESADRLHITLCYMEDKAADRDDWGKLEGIVHEVAAGFAPLVGSIRGTGRFVQEDGEVAFAEVDLPGIEELHDQLVVALGEAGFPVSQKFAYTPHLTISYGELDDPFPDTGAKLESFPLDVREIRIVQGDKTLASVPFGPQA